MITNAEFDLTGFVMDNGKLRSFTSIGGYPLFYYDKEGNCLCPECASSNDEYTEPLIGVDANWENPDLHCDHCSERIESAYAED